MIGAGIVEVHGLLHQPQAERARVEVEGFAGRTGNGGDVVDAVECWVWWGQRGSLQGSGATAPIFMAATLLTPDGRITSKLSKLIVSGNG